MDKAQKKVPLNRKTDRRALRLKELSIKQRLKKLKEKEQKEKNGILECYVALELLPDTENVLNVLIVNNELNNLNNIDIVDIEDDEQNDYEQNDNEQNNDDKIELNEVNENESDLDVIIAEDDEDEETEKDNEDEVYESEQEESDNESESEELEEVSVDDIEQNEEESENNENNEQNKNYGVIDADTNTIIHPTYMAVLKDYQINAIGFMFGNCIRKNTGCIIAHGMGLGKTLTTTAFIHSVSNAKENNTKKFLILTPKSTISQWTMESHKWFPSDKSLNYHTFKEGG